MIAVILECSGELMDEQLVTFVDIEEDFEGCDVMTFTCPHCHQDHKSRRYGRSFDR